MPEPVTPSIPGAVQIRNEPVQARSTARLTALLDSAASVIAEIGFERLTTAMVAERAGASIGTVYRYFPDRLAVLQALAQRNFERMADRVRAEVIDPGHSTWLEATDGVLGVFVEAFRSEPGFRSIRLGDVIDLYPRAATETANSAMARVIFEALADRFELPTDDTTVFAFDVAIEVSDALVARAFVIDPKGDERYLDQVRAGVRVLLEQHFGRV